MVMKEVFTERGGKVSNISLKIKEVRARKNITQQELADMVPGLGRTSISKYENGHPSPENVLDLIIEALNDT